MHHTRLFAAAGLGLTLLFSAAAPASAQQANQQWFIPGRAKPPPHPAVHPVVAPSSRPARQGETVPPRVQLKLPPAPTVPGVARGLMPPAAVIGVLSVPDVLRRSSAYEQADKVLAERRQKLNEDAQREQAKLRTLGQQLATDRSKLSAAEVRAREKKLQDRIASSRRRFAERNRIIQEQGQFALAQIQRTLKQVVQNVAISRGMNLVLQSQVVAVSVPEFDISAQVLQILNKVLPKVEIPPEGVAPPEATGHREAGHPPAHH